MLRPPLLLVLAASAPAALATDLDLTVDSGGQAVVTVGPGAAVPYTVTGELTDAATDGLAGFRFDLAFDGGPLAQGTAPAAGALLSFQRPLGLDNPAGYGGTADGDVLRQVGGAQNTIGNFFAPQPLGVVTVDVAQPGAPATLLTGTLTAPTQPGTYTLAATDVAANGLVAGSTGFPFWPVEAVPTGTVTDLVVNVVALSASVDQVSVSAGGVANFDLDAGAGNAGRIYFLLGSATGTAPGFPYEFTTLPLVPDSFTLFSIQRANKAPYTASLGLLNGAGKATAKFTVAPATDPSFAGLTLHHAFLLVNPGDYASNPVSIALVP